VLHVPLPDTNTCKSICQIHVATLKRGAHTHTHTHIYSRLEATRVTQFSMVDSGSRWGRGNKQLTAHVLPFCIRERGAPSRGERGRSNGSWVCLLSQI